MFFKNMEWKDGELFFGEMVVSYSSLFGDFAVESRVTHTAADGPGEPLFAEFEDRDGTVCAEGRDLSSKMGNWRTNGCGDSVIGN